MRSPLGLLTVADYLEAEAASNIRHEYVSGYLESVDLKLTMAEIYEDVRW